MAKTNDKSISFKAPVTGIDPVSKGFFVIEHAYLVWSAYVEDETIQGLGWITIDGGSYNPLYTIAQEDPLRLQGLVASVDFGMEKRFIRIIQISNYECDETTRQISMSQVKFQFLDSMDYIENVFDYKNENLL